MPILVPLAFVFLAWADPPEPTPEARPGGRRGAGDGRWPTRSPRPSPRSSRSRGRSRRTTRRRPSGAATRPSESRPRLGIGAIDLRRRRHLVRLRLGGRHRRPGRDPHGLPRRQGGELGSRSAQPGRQSVRRRDHRRRPAERPGGHRPPRAARRRAARSSSRSRIGDATKLRKGSFLVALGNPFNAAAPRRPALGELGHPRQRRPAARTSRPNERRRSGLQLQQLSRPCSSSTPS